MTRRTRRILGWSAFVAIWLVGVLLVLNRPTSLPPAKPLPELNGYDDWVRAGSLLRGTLPDRGQPTPDQAAAYVATNHAALDALRVGLGREVATPPLDPMELEAHLEQVGRFKSLARLLALETDLARQAGDWERMVASASNSFAFALHLSRGAVLIDDMVASAAENIARAPLEQAVPDLPPVPARRAAQLLAVLDSTRVSFDEVKAREEAFARSQLGLAGRAAWVLFLRRRAQAGLPRIEQKRDATILATRQLALRLAARAYTQERGRSPASAADLIPDFLPRTLEDPTTDAPLEVQPIP